MDAIIIGAGIGGLSSAAYLAKAGFKVLVIEQDHHTGGTAHVFKIDGFTFPAGPLSFTCPEFISGSLRELGINQNLSFKRDRFQVRRGDMDVIISVPLDQLAGQLFEIFPQEREGIIAFIMVLDEVISALDALKPGELEHGGNNTAREVLERWSGVSAKELADRYLKDQRLIDLLGSQGTGDAEMSVVLLARMWRFMSKVGIWYTNGGIGKVPELLAKRVRGLGGEIRLGERVERILVHDGTAAGLELAGGALIKSPVVISDADYKETILKLLPPGTIPETKKEEIAEMPLTPSAFTVFLGVKKELVDLSSFKGDHILVKIMEGKSVPWEQKRPQPEDFLQDEIWLSWWSRHDPALAPPGCESLMIKVTAPFDVFAPFYGDGRGRHHEQYYSIKEEMADALVEAASKVVPGLPGAVVVREVATPLTYKDLGHRSEGSVAGWSWKFGDYPEPWARSLAVTPVPGLLMVGLQSFTRLFYGGVGTSMYSGKYAAEIVLAKSKSVGKSSIKISPADNVL